MGIHSRQNEISTITMATSLYHMVSTLMAISDVVGWSKDGSFFWDIFQQPHYETALCTNYCNHRVYHIIYLERYFTFNCWNFIPTVLLASAGKTCSRVQCHNRGMRKVSSWHKPHLPCLELPKFYHWATTTTSPHNPLKWCRTPVVQAKSPGVNFQQIPAVQFPLVDASF